MAVGFTIPADQPDGVYVVTYDSSNQAVHTLISDGVAARDLVEFSGQGSQAAKRNGGPLLAARADDLTCPGGTLDRVSTDEAVAALKGQCNPNMPGAVNSGQDYYSKRGSTVAYFCNFGAGSELCTVFGLTDTYQRLTNECGLYGAGWRTVQDADHWYSIGYEDINALFCGRSHT
ncbi:hypothetical protein LQW54_006144 [Pestalotiopsis sp. IQ-011]